MYWYMTIDPAVSEDKGGDFTGIVICAVDPDDRKFVVHAEQYKLNPHDLIEKIIELCHKYPVKEVGIETAASQITLKFSLYKRMKEEQKMIPITELPSTWTKSKYQRVMSLQPVFEFKEVYLQAGMFTLEEQLLGVGSEGFKTKHDDVIDAFANQTRLWCKPPKNITEVVEVGTLNWYRQQMMFNKKEKAYYDNIPGNVYALRSKEYYG
jgi:predicted phage terminase large subunit-like protein